MAPATEPPRPESPLHGFRGEPAPVNTLRPRGVTVAVSREAGSRGGTIARLAGELLGWQVFDQELLGFLATDDTARAELLADVPPGGRAWADARLARADARLDPPLLESARLTLTLAARGGAVLVGRGAGFLLPAESTVHVRVVAPWDQRVGYIAQRRRLSRDDVAAEVRAIDERRAGLLDALAGRDPADPTGYDLVLNSARLGLDACADLIAAAVRLKHLPPADAGGRE